MKTIVVSGINLFTGGTLKVMQDCIASLSSFAGHKYKIIALVHNDKQYAVYPNVEYLSFPKSRKSWLYRLYYEYIGFKKLSKQLKPYAWLSMHDTTPNVVSEKRMVYCHNTFSFYKAGLKDLWLQPSIFMFSKFSKYIHKTNIKENDYVIVQQEWLREAFQKSFGINKIVVSLPVHTIPPITKKEESHKEKNVFLFFYPSTPMVHKNYEVICKAAGLLEKEGVDNLKIVLTSNGSENKYAKYIYNKYKSLQNLQFVGYLNGEEMGNYYRQCNCLVFPSKVESWGLPVSEAKEYNKPLLVSDLPYAKETVGKYDQVKFFDPDNAGQLADYMKNFIHGNIVYDDTKEIKYNEPFTLNWAELIRFLFNE